MKAGLAKRILIVLVVGLTLASCNISDLIGGGGDEPSATETVEPQEQDQEIEVTAAIRSGPGEEQQEDESDQPPPPPPSNGGTGSLPYFEDFNSSGSGWEVGDYNNGSVGYANGEYFVTSTSPGVFMWGQAGRNYDNVDMTVTARQVSGPANDNTGYGVMCRVRYDPQNDLLYGYSLRISGDGYYAIHKFTGSDIVDLVPWSTTPAIVLGNSANEMRVVCNGSTLVLYVNGTMVAEAVDDEFSSGDIGFSGTNYEEGLAEFRYDNLEVQSPADVGGGSGGGGSSGSSGSDGSLPFSDDFSSASSGWEVGDYNNGSVGYANGEYFVTATSQGIFMWGQAMRNFDDVDISVTARQVSGPSNDNTGYGVMCRVRYDPQSDLLFGYSLRISGDGYYAIHKFTGSDIVDLVPWTTTPAIVLGNSSNQVRVICDGSYLALYVNGTLVAEANDSEFSSGDIGFSGTTYETASAEFRFDNLQVTAP
ncbi:MAG: DUF1080 domain-containing protein [Anaerolineales bacterium]|jgi:hypothetical protein